MENEQLRDQLRQRVADDLKLAIAHFQRPQAGEEGRKALRARYPEAPESMIASATHHVFVDGCEAALAFIARAEEFLLDPINKKPPDLGTTFELLYHVYNWHQFQELLPDAKPAMISLLGEINEAVASNDRESLLSAVAQLEQVVQAHRNPPDIPG